MRYYKIAGIVFKISGTDERIRRLMSQYEVSERAYDVYVDVSDAENIPMPEQIAVIRSGKLRTYATTENGYLTYDVMDGDKLIALIEMDKSIARAKIIARDIEGLGGASLSVRKFNMLSEVFKYAALVRHGLVFHSSALSTKGSAILFSAPSGTGKSTHTGLWCEYVAGSEVFNDDSPAIMIENGEVVAYGTPWSGKSDINKNVRLDVKAIVFLERGLENQIEPLEKRERFLRFVGQSFCAPFTSLLGITLDLQEKICSQVPMFKLKCNISEQAVKTVYEQVFEGESYEG